MTNDITTFNGGQLPADPTQVGDYYKQYAQAYAESERSAGSSITLRNGVMSVGDQPLPGNMLAGVVLDAVRLNAYYDKPFNPQNVEPPVCYAIGRDEMQMAPHPDMAKGPAYFKPQAQACNGCPLNEFGSNSTGQGKACSNRRRLLILPAGYYEMGPNGLQLVPITDPEHYKTSPFLTLTLSPTTLQGWGQWVRKSAADYQRPMFGLISRIYLYAHPKHGKEAVGFETLAPVPGELDAIVIQRHVEATQDIMQGFEVPTQQGNQRGGGFYNTQANAQPAQGAIGYQPQGQAPHNPFQG